MWLLKKILKFIGNFYWKLFGGIFLSIIWLFLGVVFSLTIIGYPYAGYFFKCAYLFFKPFNKDIVFVIDRPIMSVVWCITIGNIMELVTILAAAISISTIVGIPLAKQWARLCKVSLLPFSVIIDKKIKGVAL